jgi:hypothetical protein
MHGNGDFAHTEHRGYYFRLHAGDDKSHYLALTSGQCAVSFQQGRNVAAAPRWSLHSALGLAGLHLQDLDLESAWSELHGTGFHSLHRQRDVSMRGDENDRNPSAGLDQFSLDIESAHSRKSDVQN